MKMKRQIRKQGHALANPTSMSASSKASKIPDPLKVENKNWDNLAFVFFLVAVIGAFLFEVNIVVPKIYSKHSTSQAPLVHKIIAIFILHNILGNFIQIIRHQSTIKGKILIFNSPSSISPDNHRYCWTCETYTPPRSYHCSSCDVCILKKDHHCTFAKACIGYKNYRYFISLLIHISLGSLYCSTLNMLFIWDHLGGFTFYNFLSHTFPFLFWIFGQLSLYSTICCLLSMLSIAAFLFTTGLLLYHGSMMITNQTVHERNESITIYDLGNWKLNIEQSCGSNWLLIIFSPFTPSKLLGDGTRFPTKQEYHLHSLKTK